MCMIIIFDVDKDEKYCQFCLYLTLIICIFAFQTVPTIHMCFNYCKFRFLFNLLLLRFRESGQKEEVGVVIEGV